MSGQRDSCRLKDLSAFLTICANVWLAGRLTSASCSVANGEVRSIKTF
jgi:hypothetical protein